MVIELRSSDAPALVKPDGGQLSYRQLAAEVETEARALRAQGAGPGGVVALGVADPQRFLISALAVWKCEAVLLPLDVRAGPGPTESLIRRARPVLLRTAEGLQQLADPRALDPRTAMLLFTSGSSGPPKGVRLSRDGLRANIEAILRYLPPARTAIVLPLTYSYALVGQALTTLHAGATALMLGELKYPAEQLEAMVRLGARGAAVAAAHRAGGDRRQSCPEPRLPGIGGRLPRRRDGRAGADRLSCRAHLEPVRAHRSITARGGDRR